MLKVKFLRPEPPYLHQVGIDVVGVAPLEHNPRVVVRGHVPVPVQPPIVRLSRLVGGKVLLAGLLFALLADFL